MNAKENILQGCAEYEAEAFDFDELEMKLEAELSGQLSDLEFLEKDKEKISNPESMGSTVMNVVWEQFVNQIGVAAGEDFIAANRGLTLDLRDEAHIQTADNFAEGKLALHNDKIDYQKKHDDWQGNFKKDENGQVITKKDHRTGKDKAVLTDNARKVFDKDRPKGSAAVNIDHTVSAAEIIRDPAANAFLSKDEQVAFANSEKNLNPMDSSANQSKSDSTMDEWLNSERDGQKPAERFDIDEKQLRQKDKEAREEYEKQKKEGQEKAIKAGKQSQKEEAFRIGGKALRSVLMGLLAELIKNIITKLIAWIRAKQKNLESFISQVKAAIMAFISNLKQHVLTAGNTLITTIATSIIGPVVGTIKKAWMLLKQGAKSLKEAIAHIRKPENRKKPVGQIMLEVGKIVIAGLTATGAIVLGEVIEKGLMTIPVFAIQIPLFGSLASIIGMFLGALVSGLIGALALNLIDKAVAKKQRENITLQQINKGNEVLNIQFQTIAVNEEKLKRTKSDSNMAISGRHTEAAQMIKEATDRIFNKEENDNQLKLDQINSLLDGL